jgi:queuine/archaeosine tRNA-ribosyltransferase
MLETMRCIRRSILDGTFADYKAEFLAAYEPAAEDVLGEE